MLNTTKQIVLVEDQVLFAAGMREIIKSIEGAEIVDIIDNYENLVEVLDTRSIDILLLDLNLPGKNGFEILQDIRKGHPNLYVAILTMYEDIDIVEKAKKLGANAFLTKDASPDELAEMLYASKDDFFLSQRIKQKKRAISKIKEDNFTKIALITPREHEIMILYGHGKSSTDIAKKLFISPKTVETHKKNIFKKLGLHSTPELVRFAHENKLL